MIEQQYLSMLRQLTQKTKASKAIWQKESRPGEYKISFRSGALVIDKWTGERDEMRYDFVVYAESGDNIYASGAIEEGHKGYLEMEQLHEIVCRRYFRVDETIKGFATELEEHDVVGEESHPSDAQ